MKINAKFFLNKKKVLSLLENKIEAKSDLLLKSLLDVLLSTDGEDDINFDIKDVETILESGDNVFIGAIRDTKKEVVADMISEFNEIKSVGLCFFINENYSFLKIEEIIGVVVDKVKDDGDIIFGSGIDNSLSNNEFFLILLAAT